jgi:hypothetical protein
MTEADAFFTQTIVGAPMSVLLGRRVARPVATGEGLQAAMNAGEVSLSAGWREWVINTRACAPVGQPRLRPGTWRRRLERHAFWIGSLGLISLAASALVWGLLRWI